MLNEIQTNKSDNFTLNSWIILCVTVMHLTINIETKKERLRA